MKKFPLLAILAVSAILSLPACKAPVPTNAEGAAQAAATGKMTGDEILATISALPDKLKADVSDAVAKFPSAKADLDTLANGIESLASDAAAHPLPSTLSNTAVGWVEMLPGKIGSVAKGVATAYAVAYPTLSHLDNALVGLGEFIRTFEPPKAVTTALTGAAQRFAQGVERIAYIYRRRD